MSKKVYFAAVLFIFMFVSACGHYQMSMRPVNDVDFERGQFEVAVMGQDSFRVAGGMSDVASVSEYSGLTGEEGRVTLVVTSGPEGGCYLGVVTTAFPLAETNIAAFKLDGEMVNSNLERNDSYRTSGMAVRGFCLNPAAIFTVRVTSNRPAMGFVLALYPVADVAAITRAVERFQNTERRTMVATIGEIVRGVDQSALELPWAANFSNTLRERESAVSGLPAGATAGMCLLVAAVGAGGSSRDVDLIIFTGNPPVTDENRLAIDNRISPNAAVAFTAPTDPSTVRVAIQSYTGDGPVVYAAYSVRPALCATGALQVPIPGYATDARTLELKD